MSDQLSLFQSQDKLAEIIDLPQADIKYYGNFFDESTSNELFKQLETEIKWQQEYIKIYGKENPVPRLTAWYGEKGYAYTYSGITMNPEPWTETLLFIKKAVEKMAKVNFNSVLLNFYRDGKDGVAWHSDDEPELGKNPVIASVSLGGERRFSFKEKGKKKGERYDINLGNGDVLLMQGKTQESWYHQIPKTKKMVSPRINLTFRVIYI